jgi:hypothetical protein
MPRQRSRGLPLLRDDLSRLGGLLQTPLRRLGLGSEDDPYWDAYINRPPADIRNMLPGIIGQAPEGNIFPTKSELHSPNVTAAHVKELGQYLKALSVGIVDLGRQDPSLAHGFPFAIVFVVQAEYDPYSSPGVGGQSPIQNGQFASFVVASWIRECGYRGSIKIETTREQRERLAVASKLGTLTGDGRLTVPKHGTKVYVADILFTDLPMEADG